MSISIPSLVFQIVFVLEILILTLSHDHSVLLVSHDQLTVAVRKYYPTVFFFIFSAERNVSPENISSSEWRHEVSS